MRLATGWLLLLAALLPGVASAATYNLSAVPAPGFPPCSNGWDPTNYICNGIVSLVAGDSVVASSPITITANAGFSLGTNTTLGTVANTISLTSTYGNITSSGGNVLRGNLTSGSGAITLSGMTLTGSIQASSGSISLTSSTVSGNVAGDGTVSLSGGSVVGNVRANNGVTTNGTNVGGTLTSSNGSISLTGGTIGGLVLSNCCTVTSNNSNLQNGARSNSGSLSITGGTLAGDFYAGNNPATFTNVTMTSGTVTGASSISLTGSQLGSGGSAVTLTSTSGAITLNTSTVYGALTAPNYSTVNVNSPSKVYGTCLPNSTPANACTSSPVTVCFNDDFNRASLGDDWATTTSGGSFGLPVVVANRMRLTNSAGNVATASTLQRLFPAADNYVQVQFKHYAYNGTGADGIAIVLSDASVTPQAGSYGGPLGYGTKGGANVGFAGGWLGVGIDEYGNFSNEGGPNSIGRRIDSVAIRGSGSGVNGYRYIAGTAANLNPGIDVAGATPGPGHTYRITIDGRVSGQALVTVERNTGSGFVVLPGLSAINVLSAGQAALPQDFYLSLTGSSGGSTNTHELDDLQVCAAKMNPIGQQIDHFEFVHAGNALTCNPQDVLIRACMDTACSSTYTGAITASLAPNGWVGGNTLTFSGGSVSRQLRVTSPGSVTLGVTSSTPALKPLSRSLCSSGGALSTNCAVNFADSGFIFDVPNTFSAKPVAATIQAVKKSDSSQACVPSFASGSRTLQFTRSYTTPNTGTQAVLVNNIAVGAVATNVSLSFDANASAPLTVQYNDAGLITLNAGFIGSGAEAGLSMIGSDTFVAKPYGLCVQTDTSASCATADINCPLFPGNVRAGDNFPLRIQAVAWQTENEALTAAALCTGNLVTPNFQLSDIALSSQLLAPLGGSSGSLGLSSYSHVLGNQTTVSQSISEVGVFSLTAAPVANSYLGETVSASASGYVGRMIPKYLEASGSASLTPACGTAFSYQGQPMGFAAGQEPRLTVTGYNTQGGVTANYDRGSFWRMTTPVRGAYQSVTGLASLDAVNRLQLSGSSSANPSGADNGDGARSYTWSGETLGYNPGLLPNVDDLPFTAAIRQPFTAATLTDSDGACYLNGQASCQPYSFDFLNSPGSQVRLGRLRIGNAHGSELQGLNLPMWLESWQNIGTPSVPVGAFRTEPEDTCSGPLLGTPQLSQYSGNLQSGEVSVSLLGPLAASGSMQLSAPGAGNNGGVQASLPVLNWLWYDWNGSGRQPAQGLATFGVYQGRTPLIFRREIYR